MDLGWYSAAGHVQGPSGSCERCFTLFHRRGMWTSLAEWPTGVFVSDGPWLLDYSLHPFALQGLGRGAFAHPRGQQHRGRAIGHVQVRVHGQHWAGTPSFTTPQLCKHFCFSCCFLVFFFFFIFSLFSGGRLLTATLLFMSVYPDGTLLTLGHLLYWRSGRLTLLPCRPSPPLHYSRGRHDLLCGLVILLRGLAGLRDYGPRPLLAPVPRRAVRCTAGRHRLGHGPARLGPCYPVQHHRQRPNRSPLRARAHILQRQRQTRTSQYIQSYIIHTQDRHSHTYTCTHIYIVITDKHVHMTTQASALSSRCIPYRLW